MSVPIGAHRLRHGRVLESDVTFTLETLCAAVRAVPASRSVEVSACYITVRSEYHPIICEANEWRSAPAPKTGSTTAYFPI